MIRVSNAFLFYVEGQDMRIICQRGMCQFFVIERTMVFELDFADFIQSLLRDIKQDSLCMHRRINLLVFMLSSSFPGNTDKKSVALRAVAVHAKVAKTPTGSVTIVSIVCGGEDNVLRAWQTVTERSGVLIGTDKVWEFYQDDSTHKNWIMASSVSNCACMHNLLQCTRLIV